MKTSPSDVRNRAGVPRALLKKLSESFAVLRDGKPLAIGIHKAIQARMPEIDPGELRVAMRQHTASTRYLKELAKGASRYNLDDQAEGTITPEQKAQASDALRERFRKAADQRKAEMQARERQEKLLKLAEKFNTR